MGQEINLPWCTHLKECLAEVNMVNGDARAGDRVYCEVHPMTPDQSQGGVGIQRPDHIQIGLLCQIQNRIENEQVS